MDATTRNFLMEHGYKNDANKNVLLALFSEGKRFKEVHISLYVESPHMLLSRCRELNVIAELDTTGSKRLILQKANRYKKIIMNIVADEITDCMTKDYNNDVIGFEFEIRGLRCSLSVSA